VSSNHAVPDQDYPLGAVVIGRLMEDGRFDWTRRRFARRLPSTVSRAALRRASGDPKWFMSSVAPSTGALFIDTDGRRVQDGDDF
jgi:hypothetical protein